MKLRQCFCVITEIPFPVSTPAGCNNERGFDELQVAAMIQFCKAIRRVFFNRAVQTPTQAD